MIRACRARVRRVEGAEALSAEARSRGGFAQCRRAKSAPASSCHALAWSAVASGEDRSKPPASARTLTCGSAPSSRRLGTGTSELSNACSSCARVSAAAWMRTTAPPLRATRRRRGLCLKTCHFAGSTTPEAWARPMCSIRSGSEAMEPHWSHRPSSSVRLAVASPMRWALAALLCPLAIASGHRRRAHPAAVPSADAKAALMETPGLMRTRVATASAPTNSES